MNEQVPAPGRYRHYKGSEYTVLGVARHSETLEELVIYRPEYGARELWVRPKNMFVESVLVRGQRVPRFQSLEAQDTPAASGTNNVFHAVPRNLPDEVIQTLLSGAAVRIERIISHGHASAADFWYDQPQHEWVIVLQGAARLQFEDRILDMGPGDYIHIPAAQKHRVAWTTPDQPTIWLAVHYG